MSAPLEHSADIELTIDAVAHGGDGIGRVDGMACFVSGALPGERVCARIFRRSGKALWARLLDIIAPSPHRIVGSECAERACAAACAWSGFAYPAQGEWKRRIVEETIRRIGGIPAEVAFAEEPALRHGYRTRAVFHGDGARLGYYAPRTHDVIPLPACPLNHPRLNAALAALHPFALKGSVHVTVNPEGDETLVWLRQPTAELRTVFPCCDGFDSRDRAAFCFDGVPIINGAFSQSSLLLNRMLRRETDVRVGDAASLLDLYCGNGNLSLHHAAGRDVAGIDHTAAAIDAANRIAPGAYRRGDEAAMAKLIKERPWDVILLDPPRTGAKALTTPLRNAKAGRIVYVSCNPATFARDARELCMGDWRLTSAAALDMFPHTPHVETIGVFER